MDSVTLEDWGEEIFAEGVGVKWRKWVRGEGEGKKNVMNCSKSCRLVNPILHRIVDFLHEGLPIPGVASVRFVLLGTHFNVGVVPALTNSNNWPRLRIFGTHG